MIAKPADPSKFDIIFNLSNLTYSEKNSSFLGTIYPSILYLINFFLFLLIYF